MKLIFNIGMAYVFNHTPLPLDPIFIEKNVKIAHCMADYSEELLKAGVIEASREEYVENSRRISLIKKMSKL